MITMVTEGRKPLFGKVVGKSDAEENSDNVPRIEISELGHYVEACWKEIAIRYPNICIIALQMMPDHFHGILFVKDKIEKPLGKVLLGFKQGCNKHYRELMADGSVGSVAVLQQQTGQAYDRKHGLLFALGFNDKLLLKQNQLDHWLKYLKDNPRRLLMKREHPDLFKVQRGLTIGNYKFSAIGNRFLLERPIRIQVRCSRSLTDEQIEKLKNEYIQKAHCGAVLISPSISKGEKHIMRAAFEEGLPIIILQENGFTDLAKPGGKRMEACARGQLLLLAPWDHHNEQNPIKRKICLQLNEMAKAIAQQ